MDRLVKSIVMRLDTTLDLTQDQREVVEYALINVLTSSATVGAVLLLGWAFRVLPESVCALLTGAAFRWSTGGAHLSSPYRCLIVSILVPLGAALTSAWLAGLGAWVSSALPAVLVTCVVGSAVILRLHAPAETENKRIPAARRSQLRSYAWATLATWAAAAWLLYRWRMASIALASCAGLAWQMMSVTPTGYGVFSGIDSVLARLNQRLRRRL